MKPYEGVKSPAQARTIFRDKRIAKLVAHEHGVSIWTVYRIWWKQRWAKATEGLKR